MAYRRFLIDWRIKAAAFWVFHRMPFGHEAYFQMQRRVTRTVPRRLTPTANSARWFVEHAKVLREHGGETGLTGLSVFEFGAGWDLYGNAAAWCLGVDQQSVYDLTRWARPDQINHVLAHLRTEPPPGAVRVPETFVPTSGPFEPRLREVYGIDYHAPADAGATGLPDASFSAAVTTSVFEHIPPAQITRLLAECHRLLPPGAVMSHVIDYSDHFSHSDPAIGPYNFLAFDERSWRRFNPGIHYQNRLRHSDYRRMFEAAGFRVVSDRVEQPADAMQQLAQRKLAPEFASRPVEELAPLVGHYILERV